MPVKTVDCNSKSLVMASFVDSGLIEAPAVVKPELDIRGISILNLRTTGVKSKNKVPVCANWANATVIGFAGDRVGR